MEMLCEHEGHDGDRQDMLAWVRKTYFPARGSEEYQEIVANGLERYREYGGFIIDDMGDNCGDALVDMAFGEFIHDYPTVMAFADEYDMYLSAFEDVGNGFQREVRDDVLAIVNKGKQKKNNMKRIIKINESDLSRIISEAMDEIGFKCTTKL